MAGAEPPVLAVPAALPARRDQRGAVPAALPARRDQRGAVLAALPARRDQRGAVLSVVAVAMAAFLIVMGTAYLGATVDSVRQAKLGEQRARARAAAEGALTVALAERLGREPAVGATLERTIEVGGVPVEIAVARAAEDRAELRARARVAFGDQGATVRLVADLALEPAGRHRVLEVRTE